MDCTCDLDEEPATLWMEKPTKARKEHRCTDCGGLISKGETYTYMTALFDGGWHTAKRCPDCEFMRLEVGRAFFSHCGGWTCVVFGRLALSFHEVANKARTKDEYEELKRLVGMQNAAVKARGGRILWNIPWGVGREFEAP